MTSVNAKGLGYAELNEAIRNVGDCRLVGCLGQRFIGAGMTKKAIEIDGIPGNALGAYLNGASITVNANAQDAVGDTMNDGTIVVHGNIGDAAGYAMRGGSIYIKGNAGYRAGIHMKEYTSADGAVSKIPVMVIGGCAGSFLGEYQAGGIIIVLGLNRGDRTIVGNFPCMGMHGGRMYFRGDYTSLDFGGRVSAKLADKSELEAIDEYLSNYSRLFGIDKSEIAASPFTLITPDTKNPYKQMYVAN